MNTEKLENLPFRESRKEYITHKYGDMWNLHKFDHSWHRSDKSDYPYIKAERVIKKFLGKSFDKAFSYFCTLVPKHEQYEFLRDFKPGYRWEADYILDKQKRIQLNPNRYQRKKKSIHFRSFDYEEGYYYVPDKKLLTNDQMLGYWNNVHHFYPGRFITVIIKGFEKTFESKKDPEYQRLQAEKIKAEKRNQKLFKKQQAEKAYCFLTIKRQDEITNFK